MLFQSTPVIANGRIEIAATLEMSTKGFNPRPLLLTGESVCSGPGRGVVQWFQSTPVIANGRITPGRDDSVFDLSFNPRPLLLTGESLRIIHIGKTTISFNPRPLLLTGESPVPAFRRRPG